MYNRLQTIWRTDGHLPRHSQSYAYTSRGKNWND